jgi:hypothetical protein
MPPQVGDRTIVNGVEYIWDGQKGVRADLAQGAPSVSVVGTAPPKKPLTPAELKTQAEVPFAGPTAEAELRLKQSQSAEAEQKAAEAKIKTAKAKQEAEQSVYDPEEVRADLVRAIQGAARAKELSRTTAFATGFGSDIFRMGGAPVRAVEQALEPVKQNIAVQKLAQMSAQGVKLTPISNTDLELMKNAIAGLDTAQDDKSFQKAMDDVIEHFTRALNKLDRKPTPEGARAVLEARKRKALEGR